jgi:hypothetical protein
MNYYENIFQKCIRLDITNILCNDIDAWEYFPSFNFIYNKLNLIKLQNIECGPIGTLPKKYPIIIKPIVNLYGMSKGFKIIKNKSEYLENQKDGFFWMPYLSGKNYTIDIILKNGKIINYYCMESKQSINGTFEYHIYLPDYKLNQKIINLLEEILKFYTGPINIELINDIIIETHLRLNGDFYIFDDNFLINLSKLINNKNYSFNVKKEKFYLCPYFVNSNINQKLINKDEIETILKNNDIENIRWDDIKSNYQRHDLSRLFMFKAESLEKCNNIKNEVNKNLFLREKVLKYINNK